jgi:hypothetical protein
MRRIIVFLWLAAAGIYAACSTDGVSGDKFDNQPPTVWLSAAPPEGSTGKYTVQMFWGGWDPDGQILRYEYLVTDNVTGVFDPADTVGAAWSPVVGNDSTFTFSADQLSDTLTSKQVSEFTRSHTFFIRAVDEEGRRSEEPAYRSFTSRTLSPEVSIQVPIRNGFNPADVPPISTMRWKATDYVDDLLSAQEPDSVQWALVSTAPFNNDYVQTLNYLRSPAGAGEWFPWVWYKAPNDSGKFWTTPPTEFGGYIFAVRAKDEAGAVTPVLDEASNVRRVRVSKRTTGPLFNVNNLYLGTVRTTSCNTPLTILDIPAGVPLDFTLSASAASYGGTVSGYRYGWDITDLNDPEKWEVDYTPFVGASAKTPPRTFYFGTHTLTTEVIDNSGFCSRIEVKVNIVQFTLERNLLVVDDFVPDGLTSATPGWNHPTGRGVLPSDAEHDQFWLDMVDGLDDFDPAIDVIETTGESQVPLTKIAQYKSIIWSAYGDVAQRPGGSIPFALLYTFIQHRPKDPTLAASGKVTPNLLALAMAAGSHLMITGQQPIQMVVNRTYAPNVRYPLIFLYELEGKQDGAPNLDRLVGDLSFGYRELCLETIDFAIQTPQRRRSFTNTVKNYCPIQAWRPRGTNTNRDDTMREAFPLDPNFPKLTLRPEAAAPGKWYDPAVTGLDAEVYNPAYFRSGQACAYVPRETRSCFQPVYGLECFDTAEPTYRQPVAFWTSAFADRVADVPGAVGARSIVFGFPPVYFKPAEVKPAIEYVMFNEWKLPRRQDAAAATVSR